MVKMLKKLIWFKGMFSYNTLAIHQRHLSKKERERDSFMFRGLRQRKYKQRLGGDPK